MKRVTECFRCLLIIACVYLALPPFPCQSADAELVDRIVAVVNSDVILQSELEEAYKSYGNTLQQKGDADFDRLLSAEEKKSILDQMIDEKLTLQEVDRLGIQVSDAEIQATIDRIRDVNKLNDETMRKMIELEGSTYESFQKKIKNQLLQNRLVNIEVKSKVVITDTDVEAYYNAHQELYAGKTKYHLRQILLKVGPNVSAQEKDRVFQQIKTIRQRLENGEPFAELAQVYSQTATASDGGDLGFFERRLLAPNIRTALDGLKAGQFSDVIESEESYQILFVEEVQYAEGQSMADVASAIQDKLYAEVMEKKFQSWLSDLRSTAHIQIMD